jgi:hypothetical protein
VYFCANLPRVFQLKSPLVYPEPRRAHPSLGGSLSLFSTPTTFNRSNIPTFKRASLWLSFFSCTHKLPPQQTLSFDILTNARIWGRCFLRALRAARSEGSFQPLNVSTIKPSNVARSISFRLTLLRTLFACPQNSTLFFSIDSTLFSKNTRGVGGNADFDSLQHGWLLQVFLKIEMVVFPASRIERGRTGRAARFALQVFANRELCAAGSAQNGLPVEFTERPHLDGMTGERDVAVFAGVVGVAALHFDRDNVRRRMVVQATRLRIEIQPADLWSFWIGSPARSRFLFS